MPKLSDCAITIKCSVFRGTHGALCTHRCKDLSCQTLLHCHVTLSCQQDSIKDYRFLSVLHCWTIPVHIDQTSGTWTRQRHQLIHFIRPSLLLGVFSFDSKTRPPIAKDCLQVHPPLQY